METAYVRFLIWKRGLRTNQQLYRIHFDNKYENTLLTETRASIGRPQKSLPKKALIWVNDGARIYLSDYNFIF
jgi:hypothetical protein